MLRHRRASATGYPRHMFRQTTTTLTVDTLGRGLREITRDITAYGVAATKHLLAAIDGNADGDVETIRGELTMRGSTARVS